MKSVRIKDKITEFKNLEAKYVIEKIPYLVA